MTSSPRLMADRKAAVVALRKVDLPTRLTLLKRGRPPVAEIFTRERLAAIREAEAKIAEFDRAIAELRLPALGGRRDASGHFQARDRLITMAHSCHL